MLIDSVDCRRDNKSGYMFLNFQTVHRFCSTQLHSVSRISRPSSHPFWQCIRNRFGSVGERLPELSVFLGGELIYPVGYPSLGRRDLRANQPECTAPLGTLSWPTRRRKRHRPRMHPIWRVPPIGARLPRRRPQWQFRRDRIRSRPMTEIYGRLGSPSASITYGGLLVRWSNFERTRKAQRQGDGEDCRIQPTKRLGRELATHSP